MGPAITLFAVLSVAQADQQRKAAKKQAAGQAKMAEASRKREEAQQRIADIKAQRERRQAVRQQRIATGQAVASAEASGVSSTTTEGAIGSITSTTASNLAAGAKVQGISREATIFGNQKSIEAQGLFNQSAEYAGNASIFGAGANISSTFIPTK